MNSEMGFLSPLLKSLNPFNKLLLMPRVINRFPVFILCLSTAFLVSRLSRSQYEESLVSQRVLIPFKQYKYSYVHEAFRRNNQTIHKFVTNDASFPFTNYVMKQNMAWDHRSVCSNDTFVLTVYLVSQKDYERRQVIREYVRQNMIVDGKRINYVFAVASENDTTMIPLKKENELYHDLLVSVHVDNYANVTYTILDSFMWIRDYCSQAHFIARVDGDAWVHFGNLVHYLKSVPSTEFYGGFPMSGFFRNGSKWKGVRLIPNDYIVRRWIYVAGGAYILSTDLVPFINIGTEYMDVIVPCAEDAAIGDIMRIMDVKPYKKSKDYIVYSNLGWHKDRIVPPNAIFIHQLKALSLLSAVYRNYSSTYTVPFYKD